jgi:hypothetical protein
MVSICDIVPIGPCVSWMTLRVSPRPAVLAGHPAPVGVRCPHPAAAPVDRPGGGQVGRGAAAPTGRHSRGDTGGDLAGQACDAQSEQRGTCRRPVSQRQPYVRDDQRPCHRGSGASRPHCCRLRRIGVAVHCRPGGDRGRRPGRNVASDRELSGVPDGHLRGPTRRAGGDPGAHVRRASRRARSGHRPRT